MSEDFYRAFRPDGLTCMEHRVEAICRTTVPELRENFKRSFMDDWTDGCSLVLISYRVDTLSESIDVVLLPR